MKNILLFLLIFSCSNLYAQYQTTDVQADISCYENKLKNDQVELNKIYNGFYASLDEDGKLLLGESQSAWLVYIDKECNGLMAYFTSQPLDASEQLMILSCITNKTAQRVKELKGYLE